MIEGQLGCVKISRISITQNPVQTTIEKIAVIYGTIQLLIFKPKSQLFTYANKDNSDFQQV